MKSGTKLGIVVGGYAIAFAASWLAAMLYDRGFSPADSQAMGGMIAAGSTMFGGAVFVVVALIPTGLGLIFLRQSRAFWSAVSVASLSFAIAGLLAAFMTLVGRRAPAHSDLLLFVGLFGIVQMLGSPLWIMAFILFGVLAPAKDLRGRMLIAAILEVMVAICGIAQFLVPSLGS